MIDEIDEALKVGTVCGLYHADVVRAVTDGERDPLLVLLDGLHDERLLQRRRAAAHHRVALLGQREHRVDQRVLAALHDDLQ